MGPGDAAVKKGQAFLVNTQRPDGSWPMTSRPMKPGGKGSKDVAPITHAGPSVWAAITSRRHTASRAAFVVAPASRTSRNSTNGTHRRGSPCPIRAQSRASGSGPMHNSRNADSTASIGGADSTDSAQL